MGEMIYRNGPEEQRRKTTERKPVTPILDVSRKSITCVEFSTGYIKIYNNKFSNEYYLQQHAFVQRYTTHLF
jgi:hypothetical protein